jgi:hypothetical protein
MKMGKEESQIAGLTSARTLAVGGDMGNRGLARSAVVELSREQLPEVPSETPTKVPTRSSGPPAEELAPAYAAALLKVVVELRHPEPRALEDTLDRVLKGTLIDRERFRGYLQRNFSLLRRG